MSGVLTNINQAGIVLFSCSAIWLVGRKSESLRKWGFVAGLCSQPFWFVATISSKQWGMVAVTLWYAYAWGDGFYNHWIVNDKLPDTEKGEVKC